MDDFTTFVYHVNPEWMSTKLASMLASPKVKTTVAINLNSSHGIAKKKKKNYAIFIILAWIQWQLK